MEGKRKLIAYYVTTALIFILTVSTGMVAMFKGTVEQVVELVKLYVVLQPTMTGVFFGFNFGEHWAKARSVK